MIKKKITKPDICYECRYFRMNTEDGSCVCVHRFNKKRVSKATEACKNAELNPKLVELYPQTYSL